MVLYIIAWLALIDVITGQVLTFYLKGNDSNSIPIACNFDKATFISFYKNLKQATTFSIQYTCNSFDGLITNSAAITSVNISQSSDYNCLYICSYIYPTIKCTRQSKDNNILLSQANFVPIVSLNDLNTRDTCVPTIWSELNSLNVLDSSLVLNKSCVPLCDGDNYVNQATTTHINEGYTAISTQALSSSLSTLGSTENDSTVLTSKSSISSTLSPSTSITKASPGAIQGHGADDTVTTIIIGACVGGGLFLILSLVIITVLICIKRKKRPHRKHSFSASDSEINNSSKPKEQVVENTDTTVQAQPLVTSHIGNYTNGIQIINNKVEIPVNDYELPEYNTGSNSYSINKKLNLINYRVSEEDSRLKQTNESSKVDSKQTSFENNSDSEDFGYATTEDVSTKNDVYSKLGEESREFQNPYNVMPDDATDGLNLKYQHTERAHHEDPNISSRDPGQRGQQKVNSSRDNMPGSADVHHVDDSHVLHPASGDIYAQVVKTKL